MATLPKKNALGRGLSALIDGPDDSGFIIAPESVSGSSRNEVSIDDIETNPFQPRSTFDQEKLNELCDSIKVLGIIQPLTLRKLDSGKFQLISGERRLRAAKLAGLTKVPAYIRTADDQAMLEMALVENIQRDDLNSLEIALSFQRLIDECKLTHEKLSDRVGKSRSAITNYLRLLKLPAEIQKGLEESLISMGHARALIAIENDEKQLNLFRKAVEDQLSVREIEDLARGINHHPVHVNDKVAKTPAKVKDEDPEISNLRLTLSERFETNIKVEKSEKGSGKFVIPFRSQDEFDRILLMLQSE